MDKQKKKFKQIQLKQWSSKTIRQLKKLENDLIETEAFIYRQLKVVRQLIVLKEKLNNDKLRTTKRNT